MVQRFACTACGKCCNRSPEVELSEAAALADVFVFRLMFRIATLPARPSGGESEAFYQRKRLLNECAARRSESRTGSHYLLISALTVDRGGGACSALSEGQCGIYERRPLSCRTTPFHYSRVEASAGTYLEEFIRTPGYACDTSETAPAVLEQGRIVDAEIRQARINALALIARDKDWHRAIVRRMRDTAWNEAGLPTLAHVEANARFAAITTSMRLAWHIAAEAGMMSVEEAQRLVAVQARTIERELAGGGYAPDARETLAEMAAEYRNGG